MPKCIFESQDNLNNLLFIVWTMELEYEMGETLKLEDWKDLEHVTPVKIFLTILYICILLTGIVGNSVTIKVTQVLMKNGYLQKNVTDHMVSLACSDLLVLLIGLPVELYSAIWFPFSSASGNISCKVYNFLFEACSYATILNVATLSFERYVAICHPLKYKSFIGSWTVKLIVFAWVTSVLVAVPLLFATGTQSPRDVPLELNQSSSTLVPNQVGNIDIQNLTFCTNLTSMWVMYRFSIFAAFIVYIIVLVSVAIMCKRMIYVLSSINRKSTKQDANSMKILPKHESSKMKESRKQTIIFLVLIVCCLAACWMPNQIRRIMTAAKTKRDWDMSYLKSYVILHPIADTFFYLSSVLNPFLYNLSSQQFRQVFVQVLRCRLTIEHITRDMSEPDAGSALSTRPLMLRSLHQGQPAETSSEPNTLSHVSKPPLTQLTESIHS
ncbi:LOW QUALITY PROTEIN: G-protein coupled receptor 39-like [Scleropages formosus]|uniref:LOW QUALITY PROTEIN: G-protein coupled receptor 39-like n=1 Tax=Scleropages formosus TaxID=113540 RepID=UPI0010FA8C6B|nr:LOW QUALITY PROTEIN: G-protein coupled receptor 39-like [Scleropages formosus]